MSIIFADSLAKASGPIQFVYYPLRVALGRPTMLAGNGGSRKTWLAQDAMLRKAFGLDDVAPGRVLHMDYEQGRQITSSRYQRLAHGLGLELEDLGQSLAYTHSPTCFRYTKSDPLKARDMLCALVQGYSMALVDPLKATCPEVEENSSSSRDTLDAMNYAAEVTGCAFLVLDHCGKPQDGRSRIGAIRGSSAKLDACQVIYVASSEDQQPTKVTCEKESVTGQFPRPFTFTVSDVPSDADPCWAAVIEEPKARAPKQKGAPAAFEEEF